MNWRSWIFILGLSYLFLSFLSWPLQVLVIIILTWYHYRRFHQGTLLFLILCLIFIGRIHIQYDKAPTSSIYEIMEVKQNYVIAMQENTKIIVYGLEEAHMGDIYQLKGHLEKIDTISNFHCFSFEEWANRHQIYYSMNSTEGTCITHRKKPSHQLYTYVKRLDKPIQSFLLTMLYGIHEDDVFYLMISIGMHLSVICGWLKKIIKNKYIAELSCFGLLWGISILTQPSASIWRMMIFSLCRLLFHQENSRTKLGISMVLTLLLLPYMYCEMSFILPITFGFMNLFCLEKYPQWFKSSMVLFPIQLLYYHCFSVVQILLFPLFRIFYACLYVYAWLFLILPINATFDCFAPLFTLLKNITIEWGSVYGGLPTLLLFWYVEVILRLFHQKSIKNLLTYCFCCTVIILQPYLIPFTRIITLDVGQGDCSIIIEPFCSQVIMIDVMGSLNKNIPKDIIVERLNSLGIRHINTLIITHQDYDHSGGYQELVDIIPVEQVIANKKDAKHFYHPHLKLLLLDYQGIDENDNSIVSYYQFNNHSVLFMGDLGMKGEQELLKQYPLLKVDYIKLGHHGSNTSSSLTFLHQIEPRLAIISAGRNNRYQHPHPEVLERLQQENIHVHTTSIQGEGDLILTTLGSIFINTHYNIYSLK